VAFTSIWAVYKEINMVPFDPLLSLGFLSGNNPVDFGKNKTIAKVAGVIKKIGINNNDAYVALYDKNTLLPLMVMRPDLNGVYEFQGLNDNMSCFIIAFDNKHQFNAVTQDNVVPK